MGKSILTSHQSQLVEYAKENEEITRWYFFTGGTALAECYLHHRYSEDLDFFTRSQVNVHKIDDFIESISQSVGIVFFDKKRISGLYIYSLTFSDGEILKVDFNEYDFPEVERSNTTIGKLRVDSLYDIAVNKLYTILSRTRARDFVDLYCILENGEFSLEQLFSRLPDKFPINYQDISVANSFTGVVDATDYPKMVIPFDRQKMIDFFLAEAKKFESKIFK